MLGGNNLYGKFRPAVVSMYLPRISIAKSLINKRTSNRMVFVRIRRMRAVLFSALLMFLAANAAALGPFADMRIDYTAGDGPYSLFCADLDGDGDYDLAVANRYSNNVSILKNNGNGTFLEPINYDAGDGPYSVFCADFDGDSDGDLAVSNSNSDTISILKNNGDGAFQPAVEYEVGDGPLSVFSQDFDGDGYFDLAVANHYSNTVSVLKNSGDGTFQAAVNYGAGDGPISVFSADLDGDSDYDLVVANHNSNDISILINIGDGTFQRKIDYGVGDSPKSVFSADLDGDGAYDLVTANYFSDDVSILKNNGDGTFQAAVNYMAGNGAYSVFCADLDRDDDYDLAVANSKSNNVSVLKNNGHGTFGGAVNYSAGAGPRSIFVADLDGDEDNDMAVTNFDSDNVSILINQCPAFCCDVCITPDSCPVEVSPGSSFGFMGMIGNPTAEPILTDVWVGVRLLNGFFQLWLFPDIPLDTGEFLAAHLNQEVPFDAPVGAYDYVAYCGDHNTVKCDSAWFQFTVVGARISGGADGWILEGGWNSDDMATEYALVGSFPNPFNAIVTIAYELPIAGNVNVEIYNIMGQKVATLVDSDIEAGQHRISWDAANYSSGIYFYKLTAGDKVFTKRMTFLK
ncbi:MAG: hypothetical protein CO189_10465 [candidate division Zixibacteria bacterium CG_4_9_14_3_um_filter_46_8]|nr:MAG: hypothetical protein CO189_10465 [candidate division Zixibacteria bacterium CG_4_9_14_3_um_filter_46_8]